MKKEIEIKTLHPFGPTMLHAEVPQFVIDSYNEYCDGIIADKIKSKAYDYSGQLAGNVKQEFFIDGAFIEQEKNFNNIIMLMAKRMITLEKGNEKDSISYSIINNIYENYFLVNIVDNDFISSNMIKQLLEK